MSETAKTIAFVAVAAVTLALSFVARPKSAVFDVSSQIGEILTKPFPPEAAKRFTIVRFDEETATLSEFQVAEQDGVWTIPSKGGYPADAFRELAEATTAVSDREILSIASESAADHEQYGVVDPRSPKLEVGQTGVGLRVKMADETNDALADLIVGKEVKDSPDQRYVRRQSQDVVYVVEIDPDQFSTDFEDWIEDDLLKINPSDILRVEVKDYTAQLVLARGRPEIQWQRRGEYRLRYDSDESEWVADDLQTYDTEAEQFVSAPLSEGEELDDDALRDLKNALDDLRIVDVESKPSSLSANLKASKDFLDDADAVGSLVRRGFAPIQTAADTYEILSSEGEVVCTLKDGVEYVLRFGNVELGEEESSGPDAGASDEPDDDEGDEDSGVSRYLFVVARFNESVLERPELEELPGEPSTSDEAASDEGAPAGEPDTQDASSDEASENAGPSESEQIEQRNADNTEAYEKELAEGKKRVDELNARFGDWYYVVANSVYSKIRLGRDDFVKAAESEGDDEADGTSEPVDASVLGAPGASVPGLPDLDLDLDAAAAPPEAKQPDDSTVEQATQSGDEPSEPSDDSAAAENPAPSDDGPAAVDQPPPKEEPSSDVLP
ncbi:MAG: DUF4340 domain-containing protein [Planctomycetota bacterium]